MVKRTRQSICNLGTQECLEKGVLSWPFLEKRQDPESWLNMKQVGKSKVPHFLKWMRCGVAGGPEKSGIRN